MACIVGWLLRDELVNYLEGNCSVLTEELSRHFPVGVEENVNLSGKKVSRSEFEPVESLRVLMLNWFSGCESVLVGLRVRNNNNNNNNYYYYYFPAKAER